MNAIKLKQLSNERGGQSIVDRMVVLAKEEALAGRYDLFYAAPAIGEGAYDTRYSPSHPIVELNDYGRDTIKRLKALGFEVEAMCVTISSSGNYGPHLKISWKNATEEPEPETDGREQI
jgi:hypothetical protein